MYACVSPPCSKDGTCGGRSEESQPCENVHGQASRVAIAKHLFWVILPRCMTALSKRRTRTRGQAELQTPSAPRSATPWHTNWEPARKVLGSRSPECTLAQPIKQGRCRVKPPSSEVTLAHITGGWDPLTVTIQAVNAKLPQTLTCPSSCSLPALCPRKKEQSPRCYKASGVEWPRWDFVTLQFVWLP